jgi:hypothetical protein
MGNNGDFVMPNPVPQPVSIKDIEQIEDRLKKYVGEIPGVVSDTAVRTGNFLFGKAAVSAVNAAYLEGGEAGAASVANDFSTGLKGSLGQVLKSAGGAGGASVNGGVIGGAEGYIKGGSQSQKEENVGEGVITGAVTGLAAFGAVTLATGGADIPIVAAVAIGAVAAHFIGPLVEKANDWLYKNVPAVKDFENSVGAVGTGIGDLVTGKWDNLKNDFSDAAKDYLKIYTDSNKWLTKTFPAIGKGEQLAGQALNVVKNGVVQYVKGQISEVKSVVHGLQVATGVVAKDASEAGKFINQVTDVAAHDVGNFVGSGVNAVENVAGGAVNMFVDILSGGSGAAVGKVMSIKDPIDRAAAELLLLHHNLNNIQQTNNQIIPMMENVLSDVKTVTFDTLGWMGLTIGDIDDIVYETQSDVDHHVDRGAISEVNQLVEKKKQEIQIVADGLKSTAANKLAHDQQWAAAFGG